MKLNAFEVAVQEMARNLATNILQTYPIMNENWDIISLTWFIESLTNFRASTSIKPIWAFGVDSFTVIPNVTENNVFYIEIVRSRDNIMVEGCRTFLSETGDRVVNRPT